MGYKIYACLPFIELKHQDMIEMGPVIFWPSSEFKQFLPEDVQPLFYEYFTSIAQIKVKISEESEVLKSDKYINTFQLNPQITTCISIDEEIPHEKIEEILIDAVYLLYFACSFRNLYMNEEIPDFKSFVKIIPASKEFMEEKAKWSQSHIFETNREQTVCIHFSDKEIILALGKALKVSASSIEIDEAIKENCKRLIRSIRYFVDRFFQKFSNPLGVGLDLSELLYSPEDLLFLASSFDSLLNISDRFSSSDFKQKVRPMLYLKYSDSMDVFWKWVDNFYHIRRLITHKGLTPRQVFTENPDFEVSYIFFGIKLYIYVVYYLLFEYKLIQSTHFDLFSPPDFKWIHPEQVILFLWQEENLLKKIAVLLIQLEVSEKPLGIQSEIEFLIKTYKCLIETYVKKNDLKNFVKFNPSNSESIFDYIQTIFDYAKKPKIAFIIPLDFLLYLTEKIERKV